MQHQYRVVSVIFKLWKTLILWSVASHAFKHADTYLMQNQESNENRKPKTRNSTISTNIVLHLYNSVNKQLSNCQTMGNTTIMEYTVYVEVRAVAGGGF